MTSDFRSQLQEALGAGYVAGAEMPPGGMSRLFLATETALERTVVVKVLPPELTSEVSAERFRREMLLTARLRHPHILTVLHAGFENGLLYFISPYIEGESLRTRLVREPQLPVSEVVRIVRELADALSFAHTAGIVHRDVKPENVLLERGHAVLADFGVARALEQATGGVSLTGAGLGIGTPGYMAPEQLTGDVSLDGRADLYALGAVAYEMLAGTPLFDAQSSHQLVAAHLSATPIPLITRRPDLRPELAALVMRLVAKEPSERPGTAAEVLAVLDQLSKNDLVRTGARGRIRRGGAIAATGAIVLIGFVGYYAARMRSQSTRVPPIARANPSATQTSIDSPGAAQSKSIAVLPFVNMSDDRENEYFSDGMTEELIDALAKVDGLRVAARTSSFAFRGKNEDVAAIGARLHVQAVVEGSVRRQGRRLRVTAQLVSTTDGYHLWSETYDRELRDVFQVQDEVSRAIVAALRVKLRLANRSDTAIVRVGTNDPEAHDLYLRGRFLWNQRTYTSLLSAQRFFERAIQRDSMYAGAYSALAQTIILLPVYSSAVRPLDAFPQARAAAAHALALDSTLAAAHATLGYASIFTDYDWSAAALEFRRALELDPNDATAHDWYSSYLNATGQPEAAVKEVQRAVSLDPLSRIINGDLAVQYVLGRRYDAAAQQIRVMQELDPSFAGAGEIPCYVHIARHEYAVAVSECEHSLAVSGRENGGLGLLAFSYAGAGDTAKATAILSELKSFAARRYLAPSELAYTYLGLGQRTEALFWLDSAVSARDPSMANYVSDPMFDAVREDPRYRRMLTRMNLP
ncbi:MAG TPA: protein kinase [Gemmatimonadaceae bacterium]|nr:protein kinase [Gemmatimonadaceae bacterium]